MPTFSYSSDSWFSQPELLGSECASRSTMARPAWYALPPVLEDVNLGAIDERREAACLQGGVEAIGEVLVLAGIRDKNVGLWRARTYV